MVTPPVRRRVGLSYSNSPGPLLKSIKTRNDTKTATTKTTTKTTTTITTTTEATNSLPEPKPSNQNKRPQFKVPEPVPDDIFAPPIGSSDVEDEGSAENAEANDAEPNSEPDEPFADSSDSDVPTRGDIPSTTFTSLKQNRQRQNRQPKLDDIQETSLLEDQVEDTQQHARKRKRPADASPDKNNSKTNVPPANMAAHLLGPQGFIKQAKVKATFGKKGPLPPAARRLPKDMDSTPKRFRPPPEYNTNTPRKSWKFIVPETPEASRTPIRVPKWLPPPQSDILFESGNDEDDNDAALKSVTKAKSQAKRRANPLRASRKTGTLKEEDEEEATPISSSPAPAKFVMPAQLSDFVGGAGDNVREGDLSDASSSGLSSLGSLFPEKEADENETPCPWCGAVVDKTLLKEFSQGKRLNVRMQTIFCESHKKKSAMKTWESKSYPQVQWADLETRFKAHQEHLLGIINGQEPSPYRAALAERIEQGQARSMKKEENLNPGYYGPRGFNLMCDYLVKEFSDMLKKKAVEDKVIAGRGSAAFIQSVLVAELGVRLIMEDMQVAPEEARKILEESKTLGELVNADPWL